MLITNNSNKYSQSVSKLLAMQKVQSSKRKDIFINFFPKCYLFPLKHVRHPNSGSSVCRYELMLNQLTSCNSER